MQSGQRYRRVGDAEEGLAEDLWPAVMRAALRRFPADNPHGVYAFGIGPRLVGGKPGGRTLVVYVARKLLDPTSPIGPIELRHEGRRLTIRPDVVATGGHVRTSLGRRVNYTGLHAGAALTVPLNGRAMGGGVACLLGDGPDPTHLLTAGHLFPPSAVGAPVAAAVSDAQQPREVGRLIANFLDESPRGGHAIDVAAVELNNRGVALAHGATRGPAVCDFVPSDHAAGISARAFLPTAHDYSPEVTTIGGPYHAYLTAEARPGNYQVWDVLRTDRAITAPGDSGTVLVTSDPPARVVGSCVGEDRHISLFEPVAPAIVRLCRRLGRNLSVWRNS